MTPTEPLIRNVSDTARWVAVYRARETERADPLFRDPFARRLAGARGEEIAAVIQKRTRQSWPLVLRTYLFDSLIDEHLRQGGDMVLNLAAGLDARPYRMALPQSLRWIEVDFAEILDYKEGVLAGEKPRCALRRVRMDLSDRDARRALFAELGRQAKTALVLTEGLLIYLTPGQVASLADDLAEAPGFKRWAIDITSPGLREMLTRQAGSLLAEAGAPLQFSPEEGPEFFTPHGWRPTDVRSMLKWAGKKGRLNPLLRLLSLLPDPKGRQGRRPWGAVCLLERQDSPSR